tara:strand:+ start:122 stop:757 length:636 start_codon:yes stop_codon:yes gene_type:complete
LNPLQRRLTDSDIERIFEAIEFIRQFDQDNGSHEISISVLASLLYVGSRNSSHKQALEEDLDMTRSSSSRNTDILSKWHRIILPSGKRKPGLGLIKKELDGSDRRRSTLTLTEKGEKLMEQVKQILFGTEGTPQRKVKQKLDDKTNENSEKERLEKRLEIFALSMPGAADKNQENLLNSGIADELERLALMKVKGLLSDEEFAAAKEKFLR